VERPVGGEAFGHDPDSTEPQPRYTPEELVAILEKAGVTVSPALRRLAEEEREARSEER
jgi:hypothetical protein